VTVGRAILAPAHSVVFDCYEPLPLAVARAMWARGARGVGRYCETLSPDEVAELHALGFWIMPLTTAPAGELGGSTGAAAGRLAVSLAQGLECAGGVHVWIDDEATHGAAGDVDAHLFEYGRALRAGAFEAGLYIGAGQPLDGRTLYLIPTITLYGRGGSRGIPEPDCSFAWWQVPPLDTTFPELGGFRVDMGMIGRDERGRGPMVWAP
jgi:glycoside hydrolase-like protein